MKEAKKPLGNPSVTSSLEYVGDCVKYLAGVIMENSKDDVLTKRLFKNLDKPSLPQELSKSEKEGLENVTNTPELPEIEQIKQKQMNKWKYTRKEIALLLKSIKHQDKDYLDFINYLLKLFLSKKYTKRLIID